jgi:hypothetical protein
VGSVTVTNIHRLTGAGPLPAEPDKDIILMLEALLEEARTGAIKGIGFFIVDGADNVETEWESGCARINDMVSGAGRLNHRVLSAIIEA